MHHNEHNGILADAAAGLSHQLQTQLGRMAQVLEPHVAALNRRFARKLKELKYEPQQRESLEAITAGAAARELSAGRPLGAFLEAVQYRGRRLAKLGLAPTAVVAALREYDALLEERFRLHEADEAANLAWVRDQLQFLVILTLNNAFYTVREAESQAFYELFRVEVESRTLAEMLPRFLAVLKGFTGADEARFFFLDEADPATVQGAVSPLTPQERRALAKPRSIHIGSEGNHLVLERGWRRGFKTCWSVPLRSGNALRGVMQFGFRREFEWLPRELELLTAAAERCWLAAEKAGLLEDLARREEQVRRLAEHMVEVEESERRRISRELHDEAGQSLLCVRLQMEMLEQDLPPEFEPWRQKLADVRQMTEHTILEIRRLIAALSPAILEQMGLAAALRQLIGRFRRVHSAEVRLQLPRRLDLPKKVEIIVYRLVQEIFNNIAKYSLASRVNLSVESADGYLRTHVEDNGVGFDVQEAYSRRDCFGLSGLRERVALLGGTLQVNSLPKAKAGESAGGSLASRDRKSRPAGQIGIDRQGTAIQVDLPIPGRGSARRKKRSKKEEAPALK